MPSVPNAEDLRERYREEGRAEVRAAWDEDRSRMVYEAVRFPCPFPGIESSLLACACTGGCRQSVRDIPALQRRLDEYLDTYATEVRRSAIRRCLEAVEALPGVRIKGEETVINRFTTMGAYDITLEDAVMRKDISAALTSLLSEAP